MERRVINTISNFCNRLLFATRVRYDDDRLAIARKGGYRPHIMKQDLSIRRNGWDVTSIDFFYAAYHIQSNRARSDDIARAHDWML